MFELDSRRWESSYIDSYESKSYQRGTWRQVNKQRLKICLVASSLFTAICVSTYCFQNLAYTRLSKHPLNKKRGNFCSSIKLQKPQASKALGTYRSRIQWQKLLVDGRRLCNWQVLKQPNNWKSQKIFNNWREIYIFFLKYKRKSCYQGSLG